MKPLVIFPDPILATISVLKTGTASRSEPYASGLTFGSIPIEDVKPKRPVLPYVMVRSDGVSETIYPAHEAAVVRVSVYHKAAADGLRLAQLLRGLLCSYAGGTDVRGYAALTGPIPTTDPESGASLVTLTVSARMRPKSP